jgi:hypothetical protein
MKALGTFLMLAVCLHGNIVWSSFIDFGNFEVFRGHRFGQLVPGDGDSFYTLGYTKVNMTYSIPTFRLYQNNRMSKEVPVKHLNAQGNELDQDFFRFQDHLVLLTESKQFGKQEFFMHAVDLDLSESNKPIKALSINLKINESVTHSGYVFDTDSAHCLIYALVEDATNLSIRIEFSIFDKQLNSTESGAKSLIFPSDNTIFNSIHLSNDNNLVATFKVFTRNPKNYHVRHRNLQAFFLVDLRKKQSNTILVKIPEKKILDLVVYPLNDQRWLLTGLWLEESTNKSGIFSSSYNSENNEYFDEHEWPYYVPNQMASSGGNAFQMKDFTSLQTTKSPLTHFIIREHLPHQNGYVALFEEFYQDGVFIENQMGGLVDNLSYNNNTILVVHFNKSGELLWTREIKKTMKQTTNRNATPSFMTLKNGNKLTLLFNDNRKNYNESGLYAEHNHVITMKKRENVVAQVHIDLELGTVSRQILTDYSASKGFFLPSKSIASEDDAFVFLAFQQSLANQMYRFGMLRTD